MSDLLGRIDSVIAGTCPCGAQPREGSAYCGDDCTPTHRSVNTTSDTDGTPMRWRPDLVTAVDDTDLMDLGSNTFYAGRYHAQLFQRGPEADGTVTWHLRLDDGYRFVGADLDGVGLVDAEIVERVAEKWAALERELGNTRHVEADPWADVFDQILSDGVRRQREAEIQFGNLLGYAEVASQRGGTVTFEPAGSSRTDRVEARRAFWSEVRDQWLRSAEQVQSALPSYVWALPPAFTAPAAAASIARLSEAADRLAAGLRPAFEGLARSLPRCEPEPAHPMLTAIEARRNRNTGPDQQRRAPRQINPRRGR